MVEAKQASDQITVEKTPKKGAGSTRPTHKREVDSAIKELDEVLKETGAKGIQINPDGTIKLIRKEEQQEQQEEEKQEENK
ncbi:MAG: hypothetical protein KatS3mg088_709 [Patescibacteria group bacterium]|nr:MAG: hypothetical protein KatS3mg088_709 [Patescibacteria group bacterium]